MKTQSDFLRAAKNSNHLTKGAPEFKRLTCIANSDLFQIDNDYDLWAVASMTHKNKIIVGHPGGTKTMQIEADTFKSWYTAPMAYGTRIDGRKYSLIRDSRTNAKTLWEGGLHLIESSYLEKSYIVEKMNKHAEVAPYLVFEAIGNNMHYRNFLWIGMLHDNPIFCFSHEEEQVINVSQLRSLQFSELTDEWESCEYTYNGINSNFSVRYINGKIEYKL